MCVSLALMTHALNLFRLMGVRDERNLVPFSNFSVKTKPSVVVVRESSD